jgi:hypothetical protein
MQGSDSSSKLVSFLPFWMRIGMASLMFVIVVLSMWTRLPWFEWAPWLCFGLYYLLYVPRQKGAAFAAYVKEPRAIASLALLVAAIAGIGRNLYVAFAK